MIRRLSFVALLLLAVMARSASSQQAPEVRGRVLDSVTAAPVADAEVLLSDGSRTVTAPDGRFQLRALRPGELDLTVRRLAYAPLQRRLVLLNGATETLTLLLAPSLVVLPEVTKVAEAPAAGTSIIDRATIEQSGASDLGDLLQVQGGVVVTRRGGPGTPATVSIRGSSSNQVLVLLDGVPVNDPTTGTADLSLVRLGNVDKVTLLRGAQSARYGSQALGGAIVVETRRPAGVALEAQVGAGSWGTRLLDGRLAVGAPNGRGLSASVGGEWSRFDGDFEYAVPPERGGGVGIRANSDAEDLSLNGALGWTSVASETRLRAEYFDIDRGMPGTVVQPSLTARQTQQRVGIGADTRVQLRRNTLTASLTVQRQDGRFADSLPPFSSPYDNSTQATALVANAGVNRPIGRVDGSAGAEFRRTAVSGTALSADAPPWTLYGGGWVSARMPLLERGAWQLEANGALRVDGSSLGDQWYASPQLGASLRKGGWSAELRWAQAYNPPTLADMFFQEGVQVQPNPFLRPERVLGEWSVFLEARDLGPASLHGTVGLNLYTADVDGMILWSPDFRFVWRPYNFDVQRHGGELTAHVAPAGTRFTLGGSLALSSITYAGPVLEGQVIYRPLWSGAVNADWQVFSIDVGGGYRYIGSRRTSVGTDLNELPPSNLLDLRASRAFPLHDMSFVLQVALENVLDTHTGMLPDFPLPGRLLRINLTYRRN